MIHKFPGFADKSLTLNSFSSHLGTGALDQRAAVYDRLDAEHAEQEGLRFTAGGNLDAPEFVPSGAVVRVPHFPVYNVHTMPGSVAR
jgi:hypothetical protein